MKSRLLAIAVGAGVFAAGAVVGAVAATWGRDSGNDETKNKKISNNDKREPTTVDGECQRVN